MIYAQGVWLCQTPSSSVAKSMTDGQCRIIHEHVPTKDTFEASPMVHKSNPLCAGSMFQPLRSIWEERAQISNPQCVITRFGNQFCLQQADS